jgi:NAD-dependent DNA ligase
VNQIVAPTNCPSCDFPLEWSNDLLYCYNPACSSRAQKAIEHFSKTLKIKGLGPSTIQKLNINDITQIYELSLEEIVEALNSEKLATKLFHEIQNSRKSSLMEVLPAFSVPLIGKSATERLSVVITSIYDLSEEVCLEAGLGPKATENLMSWYHTKFLGELKWLPFSFEFETSAPVPVGGKGTVCITGRLTSFKSKAEASNALTNAGYTVKSSITKDVTIVVNESGVESSKTRKARDQGLSIITNLNQLLGN